MIDLKQKINSFIESKEFPKTKEELSDLLFEYTYMYEALMHYAHKQYKIEEEASKNFGGL